MRGTSSYALAHLALMLLLGSISHSDAVQIKSSIQSSQQIQAQTGSKAQTQTKTGSSLTLGNKAAAQLGEGTVMQQTTAQGLGVDSKNQAESKWGFLKNIVNIDTFFSSGASGSGGDFHTKHMNSFGPSQLSSKQSEDAQKKQTIEQKPKQVEPPKQPVATPQKTESAEKKQQEAQQSPSAAAQPPTKLAQKKVKKQNKKVTKNSTKVIKKKLEKHDVPASTNSKTIKQQIEEKKQNNQVQEPPVAQQDQSPPNDQAKMQTQSDTQIYMGETVQQKSATTSGAISYSDVIKKTLEAAKKLQQKKATNVGGVPGSQQQVDISESGSEEDAAQEFITEEQQEQQQQQQQEQTENAEVELAATEVAAESEQQGQQSQDQHQQQQEQEQTTDQQQSNEQQQADSNLVQQDVEFAQPTKFTLISLKQNAKKPIIQTKEATLQNQSEVDKLFEEFDGDKILLVNGKLLKSTIAFSQTQDEKQMNDYYRLIGKAYNNHAIERQSLDDGSKKGNAFYTYIVKGVPKQLTHSDANDKKYAYAKQTIGGKDKKIFSTNCSKLKYNMGNQNRIDDCYLANGFFLVKEKGLLNDIYSEKYEDCGIQLVQQQQEQQAQQQEEQDQQQQPQQMQGQEQVQLAAEGEEQQQEQGQALSQQQEQAEEEKDMAGGIEEQQMQ